MRNCILLCMSYDCLHVCELVSGQLSLVSGQWSSTLYCMLGSLVAVALIYEATIELLLAAARFLSHHDGNSSSPFVKSKERMLFSSLLYSSVLLACIDFDCCYSLN